MKHVVGISLGASSQDFEFTTSLWGVRLKVSRVGADGNLERATELAHLWGDQAAVLGLGVDQDSDDLMALIGPYRGTATLTTGTRLGGILQEWSVRHAQHQLGGLFNNARTLFLSGLQDYRVALALSEYTSNLQFADPVLQLGVPKLLGSVEALNRYADGAHYVKDWSLPAALNRGPVKEWARFVVRKALQKASVVVAPIHLLDDFDLEALAGKVVIAANVNEARMATLRDKGVSTVIDGAPVLQGHSLGPHLLDSIVIAATGKHPEDLMEDDYLEAIAALKLEPRVVLPNGFQRTNRFAFVIHPLSQEYFKKLKPIEMLSQVSPPVFMNSLERILAYTPPFVYSKVSGIESPTGARAEGWLISVGGTPKEIMRHDPEFTYRRLLDAAAMAQRLGAQIMGLGAFTKVVGDAGVTVAKRAPLPITTG
ncbi:MAG: dehydrogenase, partial [Burkholderiales bacterium PBB4]